MNEEDPEVIVCAGPPVCMLEGDALATAVEAGCPCCTIIICHADGTETVIKPTAN